MSDRTTVGQDDGATNNGQLAGPAPASDTKHLTDLAYVLPNLGRLSLTQVKGDGTTTGSTLWLSSQILACYVQSRYDRRWSGTADEAQRSCSAIELGAGVGLVSLVLERLGWSVWATDIDPPLGTVLRPNVERNSRGGAHADKLDWNTFAVASSQWPSFDLIVTADTVYEVTLVDGLFRTIAILLRDGNQEHTEQRESEQQATSRQKGRRRRRHALIALERRDPQQVDAALTCASRKHGLSVRQISVREVRKAVDGHLGAEWPRQAWDGVEIWRADVISSDCTTLKS